jgi:hypothetical protein
LSDGSGRGELRIQGRHAAVAILAFLVAAWASRWLDNEQAASAAATLVAASVGVGIVPGALATMWWRPRPVLTLLELVGFGTIVSFGLVQLLAIAAVAAHFSTPAAVIALGVACVAVALRHVVRGAPEIVLPYDEMIVVGLLAVLAVALYRLGSPVEWFEDQVHVAIVRRLAEGPPPRLDNLYFTPGIVYTYPFPGTHYFMALVSALAGIDPLFTYHKLRFFWGPAAIVLLYLAAKAVFGSGGVAIAVALTALVLVLTGSFAAVPGFSSGWGQLIPYSHASDVAMTVLLPALIVAGCGHVLATTRRERSYFLGAAAMLILMLTIVHIREVVQFAAYIGCLLLVALARKEFRELRRPAAALLALTIATAAVYVLWQSQAVAQVSGVVVDQRVRLTSIVQSSSWQQLLFSPASVVLDQFVLNADQVYEGITPVLLWAGPAVLVLFARQPLVWMICVATAVYLAVMTVPLLAVPYIYLTYFEILFTPVRNVIFFVYLFAGAVLYAAFAALSRWNRATLSAPVAGAIAGLLVLVVALCANHSTSGFMLPLLAAYALAIVVAWRPAVGRPRLRAVVAMVVLILGAFALRPEREPEPRVTAVSVRWAPNLNDDQRRQLEGQFALAAGEPNSNRSATVNVWNYTLQNTARENVQALVAHPSVVDTAGIDRSTFEVALQTPQRDHPYVAVTRAAWLQYPALGWFVAAAAFVWVLGFAIPLALASARGGRFIAALHATANAPFHRHAVAFALLLVPVAVWSARPTLSPLQLPDRPPASTPWSFIASLPCIKTDRRPAPFSEDLLEGEAVLLPARETCPPAPGVIRWVNQHVPVDAVFAINRWNPYLPTVFIPQQVLVYPQVEVTFEEEHELFAEYYRYYDDRMRAHRVQPFFNSVETAAERAAFVEGLGVTHVLVDPAYYQEMRAVLDQLPDRFALRYSEDEWAVYEVLPPAQATAPAV